MKGWLIYDRCQYEKNTWFAAKIIKHCSESCEIRLIISEFLQFGIFNGKLGFLYHGECIPAPDFAIVRTVFPLLSLSLEKSGVRVFNSYSTSRICNDKRMTYTAALNSGIPVMDTVFSDKQYFDPEFYNITDFPLVLKSASGRGGSQVYLINNCDELIKTVKLIPENGFLIQKLCNTVGMDLRVYVMGGEILCPILRSSDNFKSNYSLGGKAEVYELNSQEKSCVQKILFSLDFKPDFIGIDFLKDGDRLIFNELEDVVGTRMLYAAAGINAAQKYSEYVLSTMFNH